MSDLAVEIRLPLPRFELAVDFTATAHVTGVFGPSGSGKTRLLRAIAGLERGASGRIRWRDEIWLDSAARIFRRPESRQVGYVPQEGLLFPHLDVRRNLLAGARRARRRLPAFDHTFDSVCELLELAPLLGRPVSALSGGERQRVALGRAICSGPRLLLLDEPLASLDLGLRRRLLPFLRRLRRELDTPMLLVSHDPAEVQALCDDLIVLERGRIAARGPAGRLLAEPGLLRPAGETSYENLLPGTLVETGSETSEVALAVSPGAPRLLTPPSRSLPGEEVLVGVPAREIILATERPRGLSARNVLAAEVLAVGEGPDLKTLIASLGNDLPRVAVDVTETSCRELGLVPGKRIFLIVKVAGCVLYEPAARHSDSAARDLYG